MRNPVALYLRIRSASGAWIYVKPASSSNHRLKPLYGMVTRCPEGSYHLRYRADGKRIWENVGTDPDRVASALRRKALELQGAEQGMIFAAEAPVPAPLKAKPKTTGRPLKDAVSEYLLETKAQKSRKTLAAYRTTLNMFMESCKKEDLEDLDRKDLLAFITFLRDGGNGPRTVRNRVD